MDPALPDDDTIVERLRARDDAIFGTLVDAWSPGLLRTARTLVADHHVAEDVVQEAWLAVIRGIDRFAGRSSLRTWVYGIVINSARARRTREARTVPFSGLAVLDEDRGPTVDPDRFRGRDDPYPGHWVSPPTAWPSPETEVVAAEFRRHLTSALTRLPERQRVVVVLRDMEGYATEEVCEMLGISATNQRVLLHRGRAALRAIMEQYVVGGMRTAVRAGESW